MCDNHTGEFEDDNIWEGHENYKTEGWGYKRPHEADCYQPEAIKEFIETFEPTINVKAN